MSCDLYFFFLKPSLLTGFMSLVMISVGKQSNLAGPPLARASSRTHRYIYFKRLKNSWRTLLGRNIHLYKIYCESICSMYFSFS